MTVKMTSEEAIRNEINTRRQQIADGVNMVTQERMETEIKQFEENLAKILAGERASEQDQKIAEVALPFDFNAVFDDPRANEMITELLKECQRDAYAEHNKEMAEINAKHSDALRAAADRELQLQRQNSELQNQLSELNKQFDDSISENSRVAKVISETLLRAEDAESKRDAAVRELEGAKEEINQRQSLIDTLREQIASIPTPKAAIDINGTDKLAQLVKESNEAKAARGLARWAEMLPEVVAPPVLPFLEEDSPKVELPIGESFRTEEIPSGLGDFEGGTDQGVQASETVTLESLKAEVDAIKSHLGLVA